MLWLALSALKDHRHHHARGQVVCQRAAPGLLFPLVLLICCRLQEMLGQILTPRELQVVEAIGQGASVTEVGQAGGGTTAEAAFMWNGNSM